MATLPRRVRVCLKNRLRAAEATGLCRPRTRRTGLRPGVKHTLAPPPEECALPIRSTGRRPNRASRLRCAFDRHIFSRRDGTRRISKFFEDGVLCLLVIMGVFLCGCASGHLAVSVKRGEVVQASVRKLDIRQTPEMKELAEHARQFGNEMYPKVLALLVDDHSTLPHQFDILFKKHTWRRMPGVTLGTRIRLNADWVAKNAAGLDMVLIHEMAHVAEHYRWFNWLRTPSYWREGMADYARYKLGYTNGWRCPQCGVEFPHYTYGYACAGAFLLFVDATYGSNVVRQLNAELRRGSYSEKFFAKATGKTLDELWAEFQKTPAFTPVAAEVNKLYNALGYLNGKPLRDVRIRFKAYLKQQPETNDLLEAAREMNGKPLKDVFQFYAFIRYFDDAAKFLQSQADKGRLPGFAEGELSETWPTMSDLERCGEPYPMSRTFSCVKNGDSSAYHYLVARESKDAPWKLERAWRTGPDGRVVEEYSVP